MSPGSEGSRSDRGGPLVRLSGIVKSFHGVLANDGVDLELDRGEIHALLGENGAGKSTLMNVLAGLSQPDAGTIAVDGQVRRIDGPAMAARLGIGMVHQHFRLVDAFTVAENVHLGWNDTPWWATRAALEARTGELAARFGLAVAPPARVADLSAGEQQRVEILRVLARGARILILDEPTAVLTPAEAAALFAALRSFRGAGNAVVLISHKLDEVMAAADRITVMRAGRTVATRAAAGANSAALARLIVSDLATAALSPATGRNGIGDGDGDAASVPLELRRVGVRDRRGTALLDDVSLRVRGGEVLGIAGVAGNGQRALAEVLTGCRQPDRGHVLLDGHPVSRPTARLFADRGIGHIPEDRLRTALAADLSLRENAVLREYRRRPGSRGPVPGAARTGALARRIIAAAGVVCRDPSMPVRNLSGGNQQRLVAERERRIARRALVAAYPIRGLDVGAAAVLHAGLHRLASEGAGVVLISEELDELIRHADRIAVLFAGRIVGILPAAAADPERLGLLMSGGR